MVAQNSKVLIEKYDRQFITVMQTISKIRSRIYNRTSIVSSRRHYCLNLIIFLWPFVLLVMHFVTVSRFTIGL
jgi:hypothetical protein